MATKQKTKDPSWWKPDYDSLWDRVKAAFKRDWKQTKHDFGGKEPDLNQNLDDTVRQAAGKQAIPPTTVPNYEEAEPALRFGYGARQHYGKEYPKWDERLEGQLQQDWAATQGKSKNDWDRYRTAVRSGWDYTGERKASGMSVRDVMTSGCECVRPETTLQEAARKMRDLDVGSMPVCGNDARLAGMLTDRDITIRAVAEGKAASAKVSEAMTAKVIYCFEDQPVREAAELMQNEQVRRLVVLDADKQLVGIVALADLAIDTGDDTLTGDTVQAISEPTATAKPR